MNRPIVPGRLPDAERAAIMQRALRDLAFRGYRIQVADETRAIVVTGAPINHILHLLLTVFTCGAWGLVWLLLIALGGEQRRHVYVDEYGNLMGL